MNDYIMLFLIESIVNCMNCLNNYLKFTTPFTTPLSGVVT